MPIACLALAGLAAVAVDAVLERPEARRLPRTRARDRRRRARAARPARPRLPPVGRGRLERRLRGREDRAEGVAARAAGLHAGHPLRERLPLLRPARAARAAARLLDHRAGEGRRGRPAPPAAELRRLDDGRGPTPRGPRSVSAITLHRGLYIDNPIVANTAWLAWRGLVAHGWRPLATDGAGHLLRARALGRAGRPSPSPRASDALFCQGWFPPDAARPSDEPQPRGASGCTGRGSCACSSRRPSRSGSSLSVDGRPHSSLTVQRLREVRIGLQRAGWHLIAFDTHGLPVIDGKPRGARIVAYALPQG